jgi:hypothetical protein
MSATRRRGWWWLAAAVLLLGGAAWLMFAGDPPIPDEPERMRLPTRMRSEEVERSQSRRTLPPLPPSSDSGLPPEDAPLPRDPVLALMPPRVKQLAVVAEFNAIVNSDLGTLMMDCFFSGDPHDESLLAQLRDAGLDPTRNIDRLAVIDDAFVATGTFQPGAIEELFGGDAVVKDYGPRGKLYEVPLSDGGTGVTASWGDQMLLVGADEAGLKSILDRLDSPSPSPAALTEEQAYGEVYGVISPDTIGRIFGEENPELAETFLQATTGVELHADVSHDVGLVADLTGADPSKTEELRRALGGALSLARMRAQSKGHTDEAELLDLARVSAAGNGKFRLQAGLPYEYMKKVFTECVERKRRRGAVQLEVEPPDEVGVP